MRMEKLLCQELELLQDPLHGQMLHCPDGGQSTPLEMGREHVLETPHPAALPDEQDTGYGHVCYQNEKK